MLAGNNNGSSLAPTNYFPGFWQNIRSGGLTATIPSTRPTLSQILELQNPPELRKICRSPDVKALKLWTDVYLRFCVISEHEKCIFLCGFYTCLMTKMPRWLISTILQRGAEKCISKKIKLSLPGGSCHKPWRSLSTDAGTQYTRIKETQSSLSNKGHYWAETRLRIFLSSLPSACNTLLRLLIGRTLAYYCNRQCRVI